MLEFVGEVDAFLCGDDEITSKVIDHAPQLKVVSKYGIGLDKIDVEYLTAKGVPLTFCPGVNHTTVAEHTFALMLALFRKLVKEANHVANGEWVRLTGNEIMGKTLSIIGLGRIGKEVAIRANAFGMKVIGFDLYWDDDFARSHKVERAQSIDEALNTGDIVSLHVNLSDETRALINKDRISKMKDGVVILNCARGEIIHTQDVIDALHSGEIGGTAPMSLILNLLLPTIPCFVLPTQSLPPILDPEPLSLSKDRQPWRPRTWFSHFKVRLHWLKPTMLP